MLRLPASVFGTLISVMLLVALALCGTTGSLDGLIKDTSGAPIANARVTLTNSGMGNKLSVTTGKTGAYRFPIISPGQYELRAEAKNYKPQSRMGLVVHVNGALRIDLVLEMDDNPGH